MQRLAVTCLTVALACAWSATGLSAAPPQAAEQQLLTRFCVDCHSGDSPDGKLRLDDLAASDFATRTSDWERVVRKLELGEMPPGGSPRPDDAQLAPVIESLTTSLDRLAEATPHPGRTESFRRLTRREYQNAVRDLLGVEIDASSLLPADESSHGFDNITVTGLTPTQVIRSITAAEKIARLAVGTGSAGAPAAETFRVRPDLTQDVHIEGLPLGTRGGLVIPWTFPRDGEYELQIRLMRDRNDNIEALKEPHDIEVLVDRERRAGFTIVPPTKGDEDQLLDAHLKTRLTVAAGRHEVGVTFVAKGAALLETPRQPLNVHFNFYRHPRLGPAISEVTIIGPLNADETSPARTLLAFERPTLPEEAEPCARRNLAPIARLAFRRPIDEADLETPLRFFRDAAARDGFDAGMESALASILVSPQFLLRIEREPADLPPGRTYELGDLEVASRLSFFLWSSLPDDELLAVASRNELDRPEVLKQEVERMLLDGRSRALVTDFAGQWLYLKNLDAVTPDMRLFPDFDDNLRQAMRRETELLFESVVRADRSVLDLIRTNETFLNERLAKHYGIPHVYGTHFRRVTLDPDQPRGGLLRQGSVLTVTSYATRTSPVLRGKWILENILGAPPPPPPENVPPLTDNTVSATLSVRERLAQHRNHAACAACHDRIDPVGLALENFDAVGRWRDREEGRPIDASGGLFPGREVRGVSGLEEALLEHPELFVRALTEKLLTYALGRGLEPSDAPAVRRIVRESRDSGYRFSSLILGIARSAPFQMRMTEP
jgi:hypothetical protein